ncbi:hypothetical protein AAG570_013964 [Ranatra chinensis]|uniref:C2H2-type domain-containing protein n=1 Tax=Ranatra chinensis TaxID=642074 RepID=A0ABD0YDN9_9HEMI
MAALAGWPMGSLKTVGVKLGCCWMFGQAKSGLLLVERKLVGIIFVNAWNPKPGSQNISNRSNPRQSSGTGECGLRVEDCWFQCPYCKHRTRHRGNLPKHINEMHNPCPVLYPCPHCPYRAKRKQHLDYHVHKKHGLFPNEQIPSPIVIMKK